MSKAAFFWMSLRMYCSAILTMERGTRMRYVPVSSSIRSCSREKGLSTTIPAMLGSPAPYCRLHDSRALVSIQSHQVQNRHFEIYQMIAGVTYQEELSVVAQRHKKVRRS